MNNTSKCPICDIDAPVTGHNLGGYSLNACPGCGLRFAPDSFNVQVDYDDVYMTPEYQAHQVEPLKNAKDRAEFAEGGNFVNFFKQLSPAGGRRLLDVGCGVGRFSQAAHYNGWNVTGIDTSAKAIEIGSQYADFPMMCKSLQEMVDSGERFDVVTAFEVVEHVSRPVEFVKLMRQALKPEGSLFLTVPNWDCEEIQTSDKPEWVPPIHILFYTESSLSQLVRNGGFSAVATGINYDDPMPRKLSRKIDWLKARLKGRPVLPLGIWIHARALPDASAQA